MPITALTANGTYNLKSMCGYVTAISVPNPGSAWTLQMFDIGPDPQPNDKQTIYGGSGGGTITVNLGILAPIFFGNGIQIVLAGTTPGEIDIQWE
jgi:hypothetical protein